MQQRLDHFYHSKFFFLISVWHISKQAFKGKTLNSTSAICLQKAAFRVQVRASKRERQNVKNENTENNRVNPLPPLPRSGVSPTIMGHQTRDLANSPPILAL